VRYLSCCGRVVRCRGLSGMSEETHGQFLRGMGAGSHSAVVRGRREVWRGRGGVLRVAFQVMYGSVSPRPVSVAFCLVG
jgi:hypothetical protein